MRMLQGVEENHVKMASRKTKTWKLPVHNGAAHCLTENLEKAAL